MSRKSSGSKGRSDKPRKISQKERAELEGMEARIMEAEENVSGLETLLNDADFQLNRYDEIPAQMKKLEAVREAANALYARWEELHKIADVTE